MVLQVSSAEQILFLIISILIAMVLHEAMHGYVAYWLGDDTAAERGRLTLNPLKSIDPIYTVLMPIFFIIVAGVPLIAAKPVPVNFSRLKYGEYGMALVGLAGPATNFVLAVIGAIIFRFLGIHLSATFDLFLVYFVKLNALVMIFNLIPFPPLDGSRVLYAFAPDLLREFMEKIESMGFIIILVFIFILLEVKSFSNGLDNVVSGFTNFLLG